MKKKECPSCAMEIDANAKRCPVCDYEFPTNNVTLKWAAVLLALLFLFYMVLF
ncbi:MAG TPA: zinc ribbon domain-containing protein [Chryseosolibacter sp.]